MILPSIKEEQNLFNQGYKIIAGVDEVGRGPLAGPVVAGAVAVVSPDLFLKNYDKIKDVRDSKKLSAKRREKISQEIKECDFLNYGVGIVSEKVIDKIGILFAVKLAMKKAIANLPKAPEFILLDGNFILEDILVSQKAIIRGDAKVFLISAASIIAKVARDQMMTQYHTQFPQYGFDQHNGYGTKKHFEALHKHGPCILHRRSFRLL